MNDPRGRQVHTYVGRIYCCAHVVVAIQSGIQRLKNLHVGVGEKEKKGIISFDPGKGTRIPIDKYYIN